jgi:hypothetical protein
MNGFCIVKNMLANIEILIPVARRILTMLR